MITCTTKPPEEYMVTLQSGNSYGLWDTYGHDPELFCFISRFAPAMFMYEPGFAEVDPNRVIVEVSEHQDVITTMDQKVRGMTVREIQRKYNPVEMLEMFSNVSIDHLDCVSDHQVSETLYIMRVRTLQFRKYYRGHLQFDGGVQKVQFRSSLTAGEQEELNGFISGMKTLMGMEGTG